MRVTDPIADMLTRIRNALIAKKNDVSLPASNVKLAIASLLKDEGYVDDVQVESEEGPQGTLHLRLRYWQDAVPAIAGIRRVSRPGRRAYVKAAEIPKVLGGLGICILSTSRGVMTGHEAAKQKVGGEVICEIW